MHSHRVLSFVALLITPHLALANSSATPVELNQQIIYSNKAETATSPIDGYRAKHSASATKTDTRIENIPQSISVVPAQVITDLNSNNIDTALDFAGGISKQNNFGGLQLNQYSIRGFATSSIYKNGFAIGRGSYSSPDVSTIERVEIIKGPSASIYGAGDPSGTINIVTKKPTVGTFANLNVSAGQWDKYRTSIDINTPLNDDKTLLSRVIFAAENNGSFRDYAGSDRLMISPSFIWNISPDTRLSVDTELIKTRSVFDRGIASVNGKLDDNNIKNFLGEPNDGRIKNSSGLIQVALEHDLNDRNTIRLANHYVKGSLQGNSSEQTQINDDSFVSRFYRQRSFAAHDNITQLELYSNFETGSVQHNFLAGVEFENYRNSQKYPQSDSLYSYGIDINNPIYGNTKPTIKKQNSFFEKVTSTSLLLQDQIVFTDKLQGVVGVRFERFKQDNFNRSLKNKNSQSKNFFAPRIGFLYQVHPNIGLFANTAISVQPNGMGSDGETYKPEKGQGYEIGTKLNLLDEQLFANIALFHTVKENTLTTDPVDTTKRIAAGEARSQGLDISLTGYLTDELKFIANYTYIDAEITKDNKIKKGSKLVGVAKNSASFLGSYEFSNGADAGLAFVYTGKRLGENNSDFYLPSYHKVDLFSHYPVSENIKVGFNLNNVFDKKHYERSYSRLWVNPGEPRNFSINLNVKI